MTSRVEFRRRLDRLAERLSMQVPAGKSHSFDMMSQEELNLYLDLQSQRLANDPEYFESLDRLSKMTGQELLECLRMFSIHPSKRGSWRL